MLQFKNLNNKKTNEKELIVEKSCGFNCNKILIFMIVFLFVFINISFVSAEYFRVKCTSGTNSPSIRLGYVEGATEGEDGNYDALYPPSPVTPRIDFYLESSDNDYMLDSRGSDSISDFYAKILGVSITGTTTGELSFSLYDDGQGNFDEKDFVVKLYNASDYTNPGNMIAAYDIYDLISGYESFPELEITTGLSYQLVIDASYTPVEEGESYYGGPGRVGGTTLVTGADNLTITPKILNIPAIINKVTNEKIKLYNDGNLSINISISVEELEDILIIKKNDKSFKLEPGERKTIEFKIAAPAEPGIYAGKIIINNQEVLVNLNVNSKELLFDAKIAIPNDLKIINKGEKLISKINLIPMSEARLDVTIKYTIKDFSGKTFLSESETIKIDNQITFTKEFETKNLPAGDYILGLEVFYEDKTATTSVNFKVIGEGLFSLTNYSLILLLIGIILLILIILIIITKHKKHKTLRKHKKRKRRI